MALRRLRNISSLNVSVFTIIIVLFALSSGMVLLNSKVPEMRVRPYDPVDLRMKFTPDFLPCPYQDTQGYAYYGYWFPYPVPVDYRAELEPDAAEPSSVTYHSLPPLKIGFGEAKLLKHEGYINAWFYDSGLLLKEGTGNMWITYTTTGGDAKRYYGAVGDTAVHTVYALGYFSINYSPQCPDAYRTTSQ